MSIVSLRTRAGKTLEFKAFIASTTWNSVGAIYAFGYLTQHGWVILYIGQTDDLKTRMAAHERWAEAARKGGTHVLAAVVQDRNLRENLERELIEAHKPPMNSVYA